MADTGEWTRADQLLVGDRLSTIAGTAELLGVVYTTERVPVYNLSIPDSPTYYVGEHGVWVHNCDVPGAPKILKTSRANKLAKKHNYADAHDLKKDFVDGPVSHWDMYKDQDTKTIWLRKKNDDESWFDTFLSTE